MQRRLLDVTPADPAARSVAFQNLCTHLRWDVEIFTRHADAT
jgi:hypothetical protein